MGAIMGSVRGRLRTIATACVLLGCVATLMAVTSASSLKAAQVEARQQEQAAILLSRIDNAVSEVGMDSLMLDITHGAASVKQKAEVDQAILDADIQAFKAAPMTSAQAAKANAILEALAAWRVFSDDVIAHPPATLEAKSAAADKGAKLDGAVGAAIKAGQSDFEARFDAKQAQARDLGVRIGQVAVTLSVVLGFGIAAFLLMFARSTLRRITVMSKALHRLAEGDLTVRCHLRGQDELSEMGASVDTALEALSTAMSSISGTGTQLRASAESLRSVSDQASSSAGAASGQAGAVASGADMVSATVAAVAASSEQLGSSIQEISRNAQGAVTVATKAVETVRDTTQSMSKLGDSSREIGDVVRLITSIAEQTNLLALNATIEAARAGESGKGFAVVADEVKQLAQETARATGDISRRVEAIQTDAEHAAGTITEIAAVIDQINDYQTTISSAVEEQTAATAEIGQGVARASSGTSDIAHNIAIVASSTLDVATVAEQARSNAATIDTVSAELATLIGRFHF
jgi:methyl-accepting chemotaxis protein